MINNGPVYITGNRTYIIEFQKNVILMDPGYDCSGMSWQEALQKENNTLFRTVDLVKKLNKPLTHVFISHNHYDHLDNLNILLGLRYYNQIFSFTAAAHEKSHIPVVLHTAGLPYISITDDSELNILNNKVQVLCTPGHTETEHDISLYLPDEKILFAGDMIQPQGRSYEKCDFFTSFSNHALPGMALGSLEKIKKLDFETLLMGHDGVIYNRKEGLNSIQITIDVIKREYDLAKGLINENPHESLTNIEEWIYDTISWERGLSKEYSEKRKKEGLKGPCEYKGPESCYFMFDLPSIRAVVKETFDIMNKASG